MENCTTCFRICDPIPDCLEEITISTDEISEDLVISIQDKFDNLFIADITTNGAGLVTIDLTDTLIFPEQLINPYAGQFKLTITKDGEIVPFVVNTVSYDCITFESATIMPKVLTYEIKY